MIELKNLTKKFDTFKAVDHLNLKIETGEFFGLLGPNGAGKTTTISLMSTLLLPTEGEILIDGEMLSRKNPGLKRKISVITQEYSMRQDMTMDEVMEYQGRLYFMPRKKIREKTEELLERVGMTYAADQKTGTYSKGMRQRLGIADVLMKDPQVIILDEPTLGLDPEGMRDFLKLIKELSVEDGRTVLVSSHQLYQIQQICDRVGIFVSGSLIACGRIEELGRQIAREGHFTLEIGARPLDDRLLGFLRSLEGLKDIEKEGDRLVIQSSRDLREDISRFLVSHDYALLHLRQKGGDLDEIYRCYFEKAEQDGEKHDKNRNGRRIFAKKRNRA